jgi:glycine betaine transporter
MAQRTTSKAVRDDASTWRHGVDLPVTLVAAGLAVVFVVTAMVYEAEVRVGAAHIYRFIADWFGWMYVLSTAGFVFFILYVGFSRYGKVKLGGREDTPEYSTFSWIAMMFALGVGIGLIFYGAAEPVMLYDQPPPGDIQPRTPEAAVQGMAYSLFHWCLHPWAFFGVAGLALAYATHVKGRSTLVTSTLHPLLGSRVDRTLGRGVGVWVIVTTLVGNAVTLGLGTLQINAGLNYLWGVKQTTMLLVVVIGVLTVAFVLSAVSGVQKGIRRLADFNVILALGLLAFFLLLGPLRLILDVTSEGLGSYIFNFIPMSFETGAFDQGAWMRTWTVFFWAWGISWAPYVGTFLAKISRGRTIREYVVGVLIAPSAATVVWFAVLGGSALDLQFDGTDIAAAANQSTQAALFELLSHYPLATVTTLAVIVLAAVFFVSGADAGAIVLATFASWGSLEPKKWLTFGWGVLIGMVALMLLVIGGLDALEYGAIIVASPFVLILVAMCVGFFLDLRRDRRAADDPVDLIPPV